MSDYKGQLGLTDEEIEELDDSPQLIHLYSATRVWFDLKTGQELLAALKMAKVEIMVSGNGSARDYKWPTVRKAINDAIAKAEGK